MISQKFNYKKDDLKIDFNWNEEVSPCKKVKIKLGDNEAILSREEFSTLMAVFADDKQMEDILQTTKTDFVSIERMLKLKLQKDMKEGEYLVFPYTYWIPKPDYEKLKADGEMVKMVEDKTQDLIKYVSDNEAAKEVRELWKSGKLTPEYLRK